MHSFTCATSAPRVVCTTGCRTELHCNTMKVHFDREAKSQVNEKCKACVSCIHSFTYITLHVLPLKRKLCAQLLNKHPTTKQAPNYKTNTHVQAWPHCLLSPLHCWHLHALVGPLLFSVELPIASFVFNIHFHQGSITSFVRTTGFARSGVAAKFSITCKKYACCVAGCISRLCWHMHVHSCQTIITRQHHQFC